ncbi:MAG: GNAT family N-acetyltransferase [Vicinamibacterales bacterium]
MSCDDWRNLSTQEVAPLLEAERARWLTGLSWETQTTWATVEEARAGGRLPGFVLREHGRITGWTFYLLRGNMVQIGALAAEEARGVRRLIDEVLDAPEASRADRASLFVFPSNASLATALTRRRFVMRDHEYLTRDIACQSGRGDLDRDAAGGSSLAVRPFRETDETRIVRLLAEAYRDVPSAECFAPNGRLEEWAWYVRQLLRTSACGTLVPDATFVIEEPECDALAGAVLTTDISDATAHIAQIVVSPRAQGVGLGTRLLDTAIARLRSRGGRRVTLMVSDDNTRAKAIYAKRGFTAGRTFLYGTRPMPRRLARAS